jgi:Zn-dependent membrane protease YugP
MYFDPMYFLFLAPALVFSLWASASVRRNFNRYSKVAAASGMTGAQAAQRLLDREGLTNVAIEVSKFGQLSDHYNPVTRSLHLSEAVYGSRSIAAIGVACHEAGHAIQHARSYAPLWLRSALVPTAKLGSTLGYIVMFLGLMMIYGGGGSTVFMIGVALFSCVLAFQIVTLPVEFDASKRAKVLVGEYGIVTAQERQGMDKVLNAAAMTYIAAAVSTLMTLLYFLLRAGVLGGGSRD